MAVNPTVITSFRSIQVTSNTTTQDVEYCVCSTVPTGIGFSYPILLETWKANKGGETLGLIAELLEGLATNYHVTGGQGVQDVDANGLLTDNVELIVSYDRTAQGLAPLEGTVSIPIGMVLLEASDENIFLAGGFETAETTVGDEYSRLAALAGA